ncbi:hypothetical protein LguiA_030397 [Lonicera macranthoides]
MPASIPVWGIKILDQREEQVSMAHGEPNSRERTDDRGEDLAMNGGRSSSNECNDRFAGKTLYWCRFYWGNLVRSIKVYDDHAKLPNCNYEFTLCGSKCYWSVKEDGFYNCKHVEQNCLEWVKSYNWTRESAIKVYDDHEKFPNCEKQITLRGSKCYWLVKDDGFYNCKKSDENCSDWEKSYNWQGDFA